MSPASRPPTTAPVSLSRDAGEVYGAPAPASAPLSAWRQAFQRPDGRFAEALGLAYGDEALIAERSDLYRTLLGTFERAFGGQGELFLVASPSRINWEGHHVDHQGGSYNATTHCRELLLAARGRDDSRVRLVNAEPERFPPLSFALDDGSAQATSGRDWSSYVRGALVALERRHPDLRLRGVDIAVASDIPVGASMSSSHALVLASALAGLAVNGLTLDKRDAVVLVQEGEWYTGSRTGLGDQATMIFGRRGKLFSCPVVERDGLTPRYVDLPRGYAHLIIDSFTVHHLRGAERLDYNARVFAYKSVFPLVLAALLENGAEPSAVAATRRLVDIRPDRFPTEKIYRALRCLPDALSLTDARHLFDKAAEELAAAGVTLCLADFDELVTTYFGDGPFPTTLPVKGVALYGLAECWRSRRYADLLEQGEVAKAGRMVDAGHDGDRVSRLDPATGRHLPYEHPVDDRLINDLLARLADADAVRREPAALEWQTGDYHASLVELDVLVDLCREHGAVSASLTGAGLGGVVTAVIAEERVPQLREQLLRHFEQEEDAEVAAVERAAAAGRLPQAIADAVRRLRDAKRATRTHSAPFTLDASARAALTQCTAALGSDDDAPLRLLGADYYRDGIARNVSVAGAGWLPAPLV